MNDGLTLASLLGGHVAVEWYEAVALVREVSDRLLDATGPSIRVPELDQIHLSPEGYIEVVGGVATDEPVRRLGQLLLALIANSEAPVQLRLVISQATAPSPVYGSIRDYSDALGFFERPERSTVLQVLATRAVSTVTPAVSDRPPTLDSLAPLPATPIVAEPKRKASPQARARIWRFAAVATVVLLIGAGAAWYAWTRGIGPRNRTDVSALADRASGRVGSALISGASAVTERLGLGRIVPADAAAPPAPPEPPATPPKTTPVRRQDSAAPIDPAPMLMAFDLEPSPGGDGGPVIVVPETLPPSERSEPERGAADQTIYTIGSQGIIPPVGVRPQLARQLPPDLTIDRLGRIEVVVARDGSVESAKLMGPPRTVQDGLFLSVVKAWSFQPALKDGVPVRYRKTIWIASP